MQQLQDEITEQKIIEYIEAYHKLQIPIDINRAKEKELQSQIDELRKEYDRPLTIGELNRFNAKRDEPMALRDGYKNKAQEFERTQYDFAYNQLKPLLPSVERGLIVGEPGNQYLIRRWCDFSDTDQISITKYEPREKRGYSNGR